MTPLALLLLLQSAAVDDKDPPIIEDLAVAASNPAAAPVVTVMLADPGTGVGTAWVYYRGVGESAFQKAELKGGTSGLFIARLPDGLQRTGFDYYVEATDVAGNGPSRIGSPNAPVRVERATESTVVRLERQQAERKDPPPEIHPAWMMLSLGVGVLAGAGAGAYGLDIVGTNREIAGDDKTLADPTLSPVRRNAVEAHKTSLETAATQDTVIAALLGVVGAAGIVTGATLVGIASLNE